MEDLNMTITRPGIASFCCWILSLSLCGGCGEPSSTAPQAPLTYRVVGVMDGDTIEVLRDNETRRVRLHGVDCPEHNQPFGQRAKQFTSELAFGQDVTLEVRDTDQYGRLVAEVFLEDGRSLNLELVRAGLAWHYKRYSKDPKLAAAELAAREAKLGLWSHGHPVPPWEWRREEREKRQNEPESFDKKPAKQPSQKSDKRRDKTPPKKASSTKVGTGGNGRNREPNESLPMCLASGACRVQWAAPCGAMASAPSCSVSSISSCSIRGSPPARNSRATYLWAFALCGAYEKMSR
jgi:micrococcal nuclease